jgi:signal transduction histidine kinase
MITAEDGEYPGSQPGGAEGRLGAWMCASSPVAAVRASIVILKEPNLYKSWWFYLLCTAVFVTLAWVSYEVRTGQVRKRFAAVSEERERIAREMHDTVIQGCTGISVLLEALVSTGLGDSAEGLQSELLSHARDQVRRTIDEARNAVWNLRSSPEQKLDLVEALHVVVKQTAQDPEIAVQVQHNVAHLEIRASAAHEILMATREAVCNAVQHSGSKTIEVNLLSSREELTIAIRDHGCGVLQDRRPVNAMHYGIVGIKERMRRLGGGVQIEAVPGVGTTVHLQLNWGNIRKLLAGT